MDENISLAVFLLPVVSRWMQTNFFIPLHLCTCSQVSFSFSIFPEYEVLFGPPPSPSNHFTGEKKSKDCHFRANFLKETRLDNDDSHGPSSKICSAGLVVLLLMHTR